jgi:succinate dehydrogenase hydrophobic anchor subunit
MSTLVGACVLALVAIHAGLDVLRFVGGRGLTPTAASRERFQAATGLLLALFVLCHLGHVWPEPDGVTATLAGSHQRLWAALGRPAVLAVYVIGCGALTGHLVHGLWRSFEPRVPSVLWTPLRLLLGFSGFLLFVCYLQVIARFAAGEPLFPGIAVDPDAPAEQAQLAR